jgi:hypothetical protein
MPGQYTPLRNSLQRRVEDKTPYNAKVQLKRDEILESKDKSEIGKQLKHLKRRNKKLESVSKKLEFEIAATEKALACFLEGSGEESFKLSEGGSFSLGDAVYPSVKDKKKLRDWAVANGHENDLSIHHSTLSSIVGDALLNGQPLPDGVEAFHELKINVRGIYDKEE